ncbi:putative heterokaryon incompatibility protein [Rosellinia necatrix]|uniref:Putative heterokaryon incompatibility protein n=1 Tax=Rosellinia necatrix TaxID=77044 RepID=A0A1W2TWW8_ROSNE|nr:putative heterokaryon incompatibility protein [Rosellinia necatrix]
MASKKGLTRHIFAAAAQPRARLREKDLLDDPEAAPIRTSGYLEDAFPGRTTPVPQYRLYFIRRDVISDRQLEHLGQEVVGGPGISHVRAGHDRHPAGGRVDLAHPPNLRAPFGDVGLVDAQRVNPEADGIAAVRFAQRRTQSPRRASFRFLRTAVLSPRSRRSRWYWPGSLRSYDMATK